jgi:hypothetical protein
MWTAQDLGAPIITFCNRAVSIGPTDFFQSHTEQYQKRGRWIALDKKHILAGRCVDELPSAGQVELNMSIYPVYRHFNQVEAPQIPANSRQYVYANSA